MDAHYVKSELASKGSIFAPLNVGSTGLIVVILAMHLVIYTVIPSMFASNLPLDAIESLYWGNEWQLGYYKHPPISAWMIDIIVQLFGRSDWIVFAASQLCTLLAVLPVLLIVGERYGAKAVGYSTFAVFLTHFTTLTSVEYNVNMGFLPFWGWMVFTFVKAEEKDSLLWWGLFGLVSAGGIYGKYIAGVFLMSATLWVLLKRRDLLLRPGPYFAAATFLLALTPHLIWLVNSDFLPIEYAMNRSESEGTAWYQHLLMPLKYLVEFIYSVGPMLLALAIGVGWTRLKTGFGPGLKTLTGRVWSDPFLFAVVGPVGVIAAISLLLGADIKTAWSIPLGIVFAGLVGVVASSLETENTSFKERFLSAWVALYGILLIVLIGIFALSPFVKNKPARMQHDGPALARLAEEHWYRHETKPFEYTVGSRWPGGTVAWYGTHRSSLFEKANLKIAPWVDVEDLQSKGAIYVDYRDPKTKVAGMCVTDPQKVLWPMPNERTYKKHPEIWIAVLKPATGPNAVTCEGE
ncbi:glycosyltransferase family 39 protein [Pseudovibrio brasiliensis]|nr:glycosyltransferase family 39 protein [Pseudovibrio brasiliensis]